MKIEPGKVPTKDEALNAVLDFTSDQLCYMDPNDGMDPDSEYSAFRRLNQIAYCALVGVPLVDIETNEEEDA